MRFTLTPFLLALTTLAAACVASVETDGSDKRFPVSSDYPPGTMERVSFVAGVAEGWLCNRENAGIRFSRPVKPSPATQNLSVDAVVMDRVAGPKHTHTNGEINLCFTEDGDAKFCGHAEGWVVFPRGSTHVPVVTDGRMLILYFLPGGAIEFVAE